MSRTKEIDVWVKKSFEMNFSNNYIADVHNRPTELYPIKAKLIIEIPEKKITITESEFNEASKVIRFGVFNGETYGDINRLKEKLFGE